MPLLPVSDLETGSEPLAINSRYQSGLVKRVQLAVEFVRQKQDQPEQIKNHILSLFTLANHAQWVPEAVPVLLTLLDQLHPFPNLWGYGQIWEEHLRWAVEAAWVAPAQFFKARMLCHLAETLYDNHKKEEALETAGLAQSEAQRVCHPLSLARSGLVMARIYDDWGDADQTGQTLREVERRVMEICQAGTLFEKRVSLAYIYFLKAQLLRRAGDVHAAMALYDEIVDSLAEFPGEDILSQSQYRLLKGQALESRGVLSWARGDYAPASQDLNTASLYYVQMADHLLQASVLSNLGLVYWKMCQFDLAEKALLQSIEIRESHNAQHSMVRTMGYLALVYYLRGDLKEAIHFFEFQIDLATKFEEFNTAALAAGNLAGVKIYNGESAQVIAELERVLAVSQKRSKEFELSVLLDIIPCYWSLKKVQPATHAAERVLEIAEELREGIPGILVPALRALAVVQPREQAVITLRRAWHLAEEQGRIYDEAACLLSLSGLLDEPERAGCWQKGAGLLQKMGAGRWLENTSSLAPPLLPLMV